MITGIDFVKSASEVLIGLNRANEDFRIGYGLISECKCWLLNYGNLDDFYYPGADISQTFDGYEIYYNDRFYQMRVVDNMIVELNISAF